MSSSGARIYFCNEFPAHADGERRGAKSGRRVAIAKVWVRRVLRHPRLDTDPPRSPSACTEISKKAALSRQDRWDYDVMQLESTGRKAFDLRHAAHASASALLAAVGFYTDRLSAAAAASCGALQHVVSPDRVPVFLVSWITGERDVHRAVRCALDLHSGAWFYFFLTTFRRIPTANAEG